MSSKSSRKGPTKQIFMLGRRGAMGSFKEVPLRGKNIFRRNMRKIRLTPSDQQAIEHARRRMLLVVSMVVVPVAVIGALVLLMSR